MEYSNEFLARVYGAYYMCDYLDTLSNKVKKLEGDIVSEIHAFGKYKTYQLALTPLSAITDEHAIEVGKIVNKEIDYDGEPAIADMAGYSAAIKGVHVGDGGERLFIASKGGGRLVIFTVTRHDDIIPAANPNGIVDYLRSQGYDCGYAEIPSLIGAGLAIDKTTLNN